MDLYIGNATKQKQIFCYRVPEYAGYFQLPISIGQQEKVPLHLTQPQVASIIDQAKIYGAVDASEIDQNKQYIGLCYSISKPILASKLHKAIEDNISVLVKRGLKIRQEAAIFENNRLEQQIADAGLPRLHEYEQAVIEENFDTRDGGKPIADGFIVRRTGRQDLPKSFRRSRKARVAE